MHRPEGEGKGAIERGAIASPGPADALSQAQGWRAFFFPPRRERNPGLEGLRAFAVWLVFCVHWAGAFAGESLGLDLGRTPATTLSEPLPLFLSWLYHSHHGVQVFFVLSGFLICRLTFATRGFAYGTYLVHRVLRIYPAFLLSLPLAIGMSVALLPGFAFDARTMAANLVFLNGVPELGIAGYNGVSWSLFYEFGFYLLFPWLGLLRARSRWLRAVAIAAAAATFSVGPLAFGYSREAAIGFAAGACLALLDDAELTRVARRVPPWAVLVLYLVATTGRWVGVLPQSVFVLAFSLSVAGLVAHAGFGETILARLFRLTPMRALGNVSYSFYLLHFWAVLGLFVAWRGALPGGWPGLALTGTVTFVVALAAAALSFRAIEVPYFVRTTRGSRRADPHPVDPAV